MFTYIHHGKVSRYIATIGYAYAEVVTCFSRYHLTIEVVIGDDEMSESVESSDERTNWSYSLRAEAAAGFELLRDEFEITYAQDLAIAELLENLPPF